MDKEFLYQKNLEDIYKAYPKRPKFLSLNQVSKFLGVHHETLLSDKTFPVKIKKNEKGNGYRVSVNSLAMWMI